MLHLEFPYNVDKCKIRLSLTKPYLLSQKRTFVAPILPGDGRRSDGAATYNISSAA